LLHIFPFTCFCVFTDSLWLWTLGCSRHSLTRSTGLIYEQCGDSVFLFFSFWVLVGGGTRSLCVGKRSPVVVPPPPTPPPKFPHHPGKASRSPTIPPPPPPPPPQRPPPATPQPPPPTPAESPPQIQNPPPLTTTSPTPPSDPPPPRCTPPHNPPPHLGAPSVLCVDRISLVRTPPVHRVGPR